MKLLKAHKKILFIPFLVHGLFGKTKRLEQTYNPSQTVWDSSHFCRRQMVFFSPHP